MADELEISRATVQKFFAGKPVGRENFHKICQKLKLPWQEIINLAEDIKAQFQQVIDTNNACDVDLLVEEVRQKGRASIQQRCGMMRVLDMSHPIELSDIYTSINILEKITGRRRLKIAHLLENSDSDEFERPRLGTVFEQRVSALEAVKQYSKLLILGKPGAGKTIFLKYLAVQCGLGNVLSNFVPIFISLKDFAETVEQPSLLKYINDQFANNGVNATTAKQILSQGRVLVLLEGLDQVSETDEERVWQELRNFFAKFDTNHFVITCRIAAREYTFEQFTEVEVADFDHEQIATFATNWFRHKNAIKGNTFIKKLKQNPPLQELATNPLLLTLLCLIFEESANFPIDRAELYQEALNILLKKWDAKRHIERSPSQKLSVHQKEDLLSQIARISFEQHDYYFRTQELKQHIIDYIRNLPGVDSDIETLQLDSELVLKSFEAHHGVLVEHTKGIYSFSHLTFQEYFTAKEIITSSNPQALELALTQLVSHITEKRWREVFLLTTNMLQNADYLIQLAKQQVDSLISQDNYLQKFLIWLNQKAGAVNVTYKLVAVRAFYLDITLGLDLILNSELSLALKLDPTIGLDIEINLDLDRELNFALSLACNPHYTLARAFNLNLDYELQYLKEQLHNYNECQESFNAWWEVDGTWAEQLKNVQINYYDINHTWQFNAQQLKALQEYHKANNLLVDCLNACYITHAVRDEIEKTLLLAIA